MGRWLRDLEPELVFVVVPLIGPYFRYSWKKGSEIMESKVLLAIDHSDNAQKAVDYVGKMLGCNREADITMLYVINEPSPDIMPDDEERRRYVEQMKEKTLEFVESIGAHLSNWGIPKENIHLRILSCSKTTSVAEGILQELRQGEYGTVVVGRRGVSKREEFLFGSVSNKVVREAKNCTVWVVE
jgi:nucleotide-binding universal stress UspA family protein